MTARKRIDRFFASHEVPWEIFMVVLAVIYIVLAFLPEFIAFSQEGLEVHDNIDSSIWLFFITEFVVRLTVSPSRKGYLRRHWLDLLAIMPFAQWLRAFRVLRLLRLALLIRVFGSLEQLGAGVSRFARLNGLQWVLLFLTIVMLVLSGLLYYQESGVNDKIRDYWDALYAALVTWTTPGYGDIIPVTPMGRVYGLALIISGLVTWGVLVANLAAFLSSRLARQREVENADAAVYECQQKLSQLDGLSRGELVALRGALDALIDDRMKGKD